METKSQSCCDTGNCIGKELASLLDPEAPIVDRISVAACGVAQTCGSLDIEELQFCAARLFDVPPECDLASAFVIAYETERDAMAERRRYEKRRATRLG